MLRIADQKVMWLFSRLEKTTAKTPRPTRYPNRSVDKDAIGRWVNTNTNVNKNNDKGITQIKGTEPMSVESFVVIANIIDEGTNAIRAQRSFVCTLGAI